MTTIQTLTVEDLNEAVEGSYYFIAGCGGDLQEWIDGYEKLLAEQGIGKPVKWVRTTGEIVNRFAERYKGGMLSRHDAFQSDLNCLLFPLNGLSTGRLAMFKLRMEDRWFDDVVANMRVVKG